MTALPDVPRLRLRHAPVLVFLLSLLVAGSLAWYVARAARERARLQFVADAEAARADIERALAAYRALLLATRSFVSSSDTVTPDRFRAYMSGLDLRERYEGLLGIGYTLVVPEGREAEVARSLRAGGLPEFEFQPSPPGVPHHAIVMLEPLDERNRAALGFNMYAEPTRRAAMDVARDEARVAASGRVRLVQEITPEKQAGFLVYLPVYRGGITPATVAERRARLVGFVYSPIRAGDFVEAALRPLEYRDLAVRVYDGTTVDTSALLYAGEPRGAPVRFVSRRALDVAGRTWTLVFEGSHGVGATGADEALAVLGLGLGVALALGVVTRGLASAQLRAERAFGELRASEQALALSERRFRALFEQSPFSVQVIDLEGRTIAANRSYEELWGVTAADLREHDMFADPQLAQRGIAPLLRGVAEGGPPVVLPPVPYVPDRGPRRGTEVWTRTIAYPVKDDADRVREIVLMHEDITDRRRVESRLHYQLELMDAITRHAAEGLFLMDAEGRVTFANPAAERMFGWSFEELRGQVLHDLLHGRRPDGRPFPAAECPLVGVFRSGVAVVDHEDWFMHRDGRFVPVSCSNAPIVQRGRTTGAVLVVRDVTERHAAEAALRESEERFRTLVDDIPQLAWMAEADGTIVWYNRRWHEFTGASPEELVAEGWFRLCHPEHRERIEASYRRSIEAGVRWEETFPLRGADGRYRWFLSRAVPTRDADGRVVRWLGTDTDVTEQREADEALRHTQKLESIGVLAGGIAHDFNNLLTGILGNASLAKRGLSPDSRAKIGALLDDVVRASERAAELTNQLLAYAGKGRFYIEAVDVAALARELAGLLRSSIPRKVALELDLPERLPPVEADASQLQQLVMNLVINGAEAIGDGTGTVRVAMRPERLDAAEARQAYPGFELAPGPYVRLEVADDGAGMDEATLARIFDPFFTTKFTGRGLGLAAALGIVRGHRGAITVRSRPNEGTVFTVLLPAAPDAAPPAPHEVQAPVIAAPESTGTVLVVEDEPMLRELAEVALLDAGFDVVLAADGAEAVERFAEAPERIDLVLLDLTMPVMNGEEALARLQALRADVRVLVMSGYGEVATLDRLAGREVLGVLPKPFTVDDLVGAVRAALR